MGSIIEATILHHLCIVLFLLWILNFFNYGYSFAYYLGFAYLYFVHEVYVQKLRKKLRFAERRESDQRRLLSESETVRWLNSATEKLWPIFMEDFVSQKMLLPIAPWFLQKYKPWTVRDVAMHHLYLGRSPPTFTDMRVVQQSNGDDHLVLELGMNFLTADDMSAILGVKLRKRLGFGMSAKLHLLGLHVEGKVLVGIKFLRKWPFISRLRVCFLGPPYFQMIMKPIFTHGLDVTVLPGIAGWIDNLLALVFEQTLVEPNMLVVDVEKFVSPQQENWFSIDAKEPIALATVEVLEAVEVKPSDLNGLPDPYVKGHLGPYRFRTKTHKKTSSPKWLEEFKIPICSWESQNSLTLEVRDKDHLFDNSLGDCLLNINELRDGQRHDLWLSLRNMKMGRVHVAVTVSEVNDSDSPSDDAQVPEEEDNRTSVEEANSVNPQVIGDKFEPIGVEGQAKTGIWIHRPGREAPQVWKPRKGKGRRLDTPNINATTRTSSQSEGSSTGESTEPSKLQSNNPVLKGLKRLGSSLRRRAAEKSFVVGEEPEKYPGVDRGYDNIRSSSSKISGVKLMIDESMLASSPKEVKDDYRELVEENKQDSSPRQQSMRLAAKGILKQAGRSARGLKNELLKRASTKSKAGSRQKQDDDNWDADSSDDELLG